MSQRSTLSRFLFSTTANRRTWQTVVAAGAMLGTAYLAQPAAADEVDETPTRVAQAPEEKKAPVPPPAAATPVTFDQAELDLGTVTAGSKKTVEFTFTNSSAGPVKIDKKMIKSSCTCLVAKPPKEPIPAGGKGLITATFTAPSKTGATSKNLTIKFTGADKAVTSMVLAVKSTIEPRPRPRTTVGEGKTGRGFILS